MEDLYSLNLERSRPLDGWFGRSGALGLDSISEILRLYRIIDKLYIHVTNKPAHPTKISDPSAFLCLSIL